MELAQEIIPENNFKTFKCVFLDFSVFQCSNIGRKTGSRKFDERGSGRSLYVVTLRTITLSREEGKLKISVNN